MTEPHSEPHPDPHYNHVNIPSNTKKILSADGINYYFRDHNNNWILTHAWSPAKQQILIGKPNDYDKYLVPFKAKL